MPGSHRVDVGGYEDDEGEGAEPGVADGGEDVERHGGAGEVAQCRRHHPHRQRQRYQVEDPHLSAPLLSPAGAAAASSRVACLRRIVDGRRAEKPSGRDVLVRRGGE